MSSIPIVKIILLGNPAVGKTSIMKRFVSGDFSETEPGTVKPVDIERVYISVNGCRMVLSIHDTAGQERYHSIASNYYHKCHGVILVYDVTKYESYESLKEWHEKVQKHCEAAAVLIVANKCDGDYMKKAVNVGAVRRLSELEHYEFVETSAKDDVNVKEAFCKLIRLILVKIKFMQEDEDVNIRVLPRPQGKEPLEEFANELASLDEKEEQMRGLKRNLEKLLQKQLNASVSYDAEGTVTLTEQVEADEGTKKGWCSC